MDPVSALMTAVIVMGGGSVPGGVIKSEVPKPAVALKTLDPNPKRRVPASIAGTYSTDPASPDEPTEND